MTMLHRGNKENMVLPRLRYFYKYKIPLSKRGKGRYRLGERVSWASHTGVVIEVIPYGRYPGKRKGLRVKGYYREYESYIVMDDKENSWWPRVGCLRTIDL